MNFLTIIGTIKNLIINKDKDSIIELCVDDTAYQGNLNQNEYQYISVYANSEIFSRELKLLQKNLIIGIKGRIENRQGNLVVIAERVRPF